MQPKIYFDVYTAVLTAHASWEAHTEKQPAASDSAAYQELVALGARTLAYLRYLYPMQGPLPRTGGQGLVRLVRDITAGDRIPFEPLAGEGFAAAHAYLEQHVERLLLETCPCGPISATSSEAFP